MSNAWGIAAAIVVWAAGLTGILVVTAPEEMRALWRRSVQPRRLQDARGAAARRDLALQLRRTAGLVRDRAGEAADLRPFRRVRPGGSMTPTNTSEPAIDPLAQQAATLLAKAMVTSHDRDLLWHRFHELVVATAAELEEAPVRDAIDEIERRGLRLDVVARVVQQRLSE
jgi:hypothetical protein